MRTRTVQDVMTTTVVVVQPDTGYKELVDLLARHGVSALPVLTPDGQVAGVVSEADLLHRLEFPAGTPHARLFERRRHATAAKAAADHAAGLMTTPAVTIAPDASIAEAARLMDRHDVKRLPVVTADGHLAGIVSRRDLLRTFLRTDDELRQDVLDGVLRRMVTEDPSTVGVNVTDGVVTLQGAADRRSSAELAVRLTAALPGVVSVVDKLTWAYDDSEEIRHRYTFDAEIGPAHHA